MSEKHHQLFPFLLHWAHAQVPCFFQEVRLKNCQIKVTRDEVLGRIDKLKRNITGSRQQHSLRIQMCCLHAQLVVLPEASAERQQPLMVTGCWTRRTCSLNQLGFCYNNMTIGTTMCWVTFI